MRKYNYSKEEVQEIKEKALLSDFQTRLIEYRIKDYSVVEMALKECCSESKISTEFKKIDKKIARVDD